jgi:hypothetical protein
MMAYCRWSSDNWKSDVYVYEGDCFVIHVASRRRVGVENLPPEPLATITSDDRDVWMKKYREHREMLESLPLVDIGLPHDGETIECSDASDCVAALLLLRAEGYHVPQHAIDALAEEIKDGE